MRPMSMVQSLPARSDSAYGISTFPVDVDEILVTVDVPSEEIDIVGDWRASVPTVADQLGGDTLMDLALSPRIDEQREVGVAVDIDKPGGNHVADSIEGQRRLSCTQVTHATI